MILWLRGPSIPFAEPGDGECAVTAGGERVAVSGGSGHHDGVGGVYVLLPHRTGWAWGSVTQASYWVTAGRIVAVDDEERVGAKGVGRATTWRRLVCAFRGRVRRSRMRVVIGASLRCCMPRCLVLDLH